MLLCKVINFPFQLKNSSEGKKGKENVIYLIKDITKPVSKIFFDVPGYYDGITLSGDGRTLYVSHWAPNGVTAIDVQSKKATPINFKTQLEGAAEFALWGNKIYLPDLNGKVIVKKIK